MNWLYKFVERQESIGVIVGVGVGEISYQV